MEVIIKPDADAVSKEAARLFQRQLKRSDYYRWVFDHKPDWQRA